MLRKRFAKIFVLLLLACSAIIVSTPKTIAAEPGVMPGSAQAPSLKDNLLSIGQNAGYESAGVNESSLTAYIGGVVSIFLSLLGIIFVVLIITAGYNWMTASGDAAKMDKAKSTIWRAVIGLIIIVGAYAIWSFISSRIL